MKMFRLTKDCGRVLIEAGLKDLIAKEMSESQIMKVIDRLADKSAHLAKRFIEAVERAAENDEAKAEREAAEKLRYALKYHAVEVEEVFIKSRKGVPQSIYIAQIEAHEDVPDELVGFWRTSYADDLRYKNFSECTLDDSWERTRSIEVTKTVWEGAEPE